MRSGEAVKYASSLDAFRQIVKVEGGKAVFRGAGANSTSPLIGLSRLNLASLTRSVSLAWRA